jgi:hypothetical protein
MAVGIAPFATRRSDMSNRRWFAIAVAIGLGAGAYWFATTSASDGADSPVQAAGDRTVVQPNESGKLEVDGGGRADGTAERESVAPPPNEDRPKRVVTGRVVDGERRGAGGVAVAASNGGEIVATTTSIGDGKFEVAIDPTTVGLEGLTLRATATDGRVGTRAWRPESKRDDVGAIVLDPTAALRVRVTQGGRPVPRALVEVETGALRGRFGSFEADANGIVIVERAPLGFVWVAASSVGVAARARAFLPDQSEVEVKLEPTVRYAAIVVDKESGDPIANARVSVFEMFGVPYHVDPEKPWGARGDSYTMREVEALRTTTDASGLASFPELPVGAAFDLRVEADGYQPNPASRFGGSIRLSVSAQPQRVELERSKGRRVTVPVIAGELPVPAAGTPLAISFAPGGRHFGDERAAPEGVTMGVSEIVIPSWDDWGLFHVHTPEGAVAFLNVQPDKDVGVPTSFVRARSITVHVKDPEGRSVAGASCTALNQGNNPFGEAAKTDATGTARIEGLTADLVNVLVSAADEVGRGFDAGSVDTTHGDASIDVTLPPVVQVRLRLLIDGVARLPAHYSVRAGMYPARVKEELAEKGETLVGVSLPASELSLPLKLWIKAAERKGEVEVMPVLAGEAFGVVDLVKESRLDVLVTRPPKTRVEIGIEKQNEQTGAFEPARQHEAIAVPNGPGDTFRFHDLAPGVYRAFEEKSKKTSESVDVAPGAVERVEFVLAQQAKLRGRVVAPEGIDWSEVRVVLEGESLAVSGDWRPNEETPHGAYVQGDGSFEIVFEAGKGVTIRPWHPWLQPAKVGGSVVARENADNVTLHLEGAQQFVLPAPMLANGGYWDRIRVGVWDGERTGAPQRWLRALYADGVIRFGGLEPGRYSLFVDPRYRFAPLELRDAEATSGATELPPANFVEGSRVRVRILTTAGFDPPRIYVYAQSVDDPSYFRDLNSDGEAEPVVTGLGPGRFRVRVALINGAARRELEREVVLDGVGETTIDYDLR